MDTCNAINTILVNCIFFYNFYIIKVFQARQFILLSFDKLPKLRFFNISDSDAINSNKGVDQFVNSIDGFDYKIIKETENKLKNRFARKRHDQLRIFL